MFVPFISTRSSTTSRSGKQERRIRWRTNENVSLLLPRLGGGGGGGGGSKGGGGGSSGGGSKGGSSGSSSGSKGGSSGSSGSGSKGGSSSSSGSGSKGGSSGGSKGGSSGSSSGSKGSSSVNTGTGSRPASVSSSGGGPVVIIPNGRPFGGRPIGGGTRGQIWGTRGYGSGYPGNFGLGTFGRGFPYYYWPVVWWSGPAYLHPDEYGSPDNSTRPGGVLSTAAFTNQTNQTTTLRIISDSDTVTTLVPIITDSCSQFIQNPSSITPTSYSKDPNSLPKPEQAIQYYRASSIVLTLDGYNDTVALQGNGTSSPDVPLPMGINMDFVNCVNNTIGRNAPLIDTSTDSWAAPGWRQTPITGVMGLVWLVCMLVASV